MVTKSSPDASHNHVTTSQTILGLLIILSILLNVMSLYFAMGYSAPISKSMGHAPSDIGAQVRQAVLDLEYEKVGGQENYDILQKYSQMQISEQIGKIKEFVAQGAGTMPSAAPQGTLSQEEIQAILADGYLEGNKDATIVAIEYSDMECPFCMRQYHETKLFPALLAQYGDQIAVSFKNNRGVNHQGTEAKAIATLCAGKIAGADAYNAYYKGIMDKSTNNNAVFPVSDLATLARTQKLDMTKWQACVDNKDTLPQFTAQTAEAQKYGLGGTPGTLLLNVKTGEYATVEGAYPYATFTAKIEELLK